MREVEGSIIEQGFRVVLIPVMQSCHILVVYWYLVVKCIQLTLGGEVSSGFW